VLDFKTHTGAGIIDGLNGILDLMQTACKDIKK
jgi:hypothetical protein